jgi:hypothetical protein
MFKVSEDVIRHVIKGFHIPPKNKQTDTKNKQTDTIQRKIRHVIKNSAVNTPNFK